MGTDEQSVVDPNGLVYGLDGLRIADASIFPQIVNCNLNATVIMVAEKISDEIKKKYAWATTRLKVAEREGFEPSIGFCPYTHSLIKSVSYSEGTTDF